MPGGSLSKRSKSVRIAYRVCSALAACYHIPKPDTLHGNSSFGWNVYIHI